MGTLGKVKKNLRPTQPFWGICSCMGMKSSDFMMKKAFLLFVLGMLSTVYSQNLPIISGRVLDAIGRPVVGDTIGIEGFTTSPTTIFFSDTVTTDSAGQFNVAFGNGAFFGEVNVYIENCSFIGGTLLDSMSFSPQDSLLFFDFVWCQGACDAAFGYTSQGLRADFLDQSTSYYGLTSRNWDFGDGNSAQGLQVSHLYTSSGSYTVCLETRDSSGCINTFCDTILVNTCSGDFSWTQTVAHTIDLTAQSMNTPNPTFSWDFGDGNQASGAQLNHVYAAPGTYSVQLILSDSNTNCMDTVIQQVLVLGDNECQAAFTPIFISQDSVFFENNSTHSLPGGGSSTYTWTFGDGGISTNVSPSHTYQNPGDYLVCMLMEDDFGCRDSICQTVRVLPGPVCNPDFVFNQISNLTVAFSALFSEGGNTYNWTLEDGSTYQTNSFFHTFSRPGIYEICLRVTDSTGSCTDSLCQQLTLSPEELCVADFSWNRLDSNEVAFYSLASAADPSSIRYTWDFGDGMRDFAVNPVHRYDSASVWEVCLFVSDLNNNCVQERCYTLDLGQPLPSSREISGWIYLNGLPSFDARADLFRNVQMQDFLEKTGEDSCSFEAYRLTNVVDGSYLIYAEEMEKTGFIPTYLGDKLHWQEAISSVVFGRNVVNPPLNMIRGMDISGTSVIKGKVFDGLNQLDGPPLTDQVVLLLADDASRSPIAYRRTDSDGGYVFSDLPIGSYWVQPEIPGIYMAPKRVDIGMAGVEITGIGFGIGQGFGFPVKVEQEIYFQVQPNPADYFVEITNSEQMALRILNSLGQLMVERKQIQENKVRISTKEWPTGIYFLEMANRNKKIRKSLMIRH